MIKWQLKTFRTKDLKEYSKNPRKLSKHQYEHLKTSIEKFGLIDKPIVTEDGILIGGHQRKKILEKTGVKEVECYVPDRTLSDKEIEELNIRLNKNTGEWDFDILTTQWDHNDLLSWGFEKSELPEIVQPDIVEDGDDVLEPCNDEDAKTKLGDAFELNNHRLVCGDSTNPDVVSKCLNGKEPILMVTDPPYGVNYDATWRDGVGKFKNPSMRGKVQNDDKVNWSLAWHLFPGSIIYIWHAGKYCSEVQKSIEEANFEIISQIVWVKQHLVLSRGDYHWKHEPCWYACKKGSKHNWQGERDQTTTWEISNLNPMGKSKNEDEKTIHSTQKPIECMARPIKNNTAKGEGVYDPFLGSGTTLVAAEQLDRICYGIELSPAYCDIIIDRWIKTMKRQGKTYKITRNGQETKDFDA
jgi:DNA modification methylase